MKKYLLKIQTKIDRHKTIISNFSYLSVIQIFNMLIPLITYPYLIRVLGKETYGLVVFAQAIIGYLLILVTFGFNISATKEISVNRENKEKLSEVVSSVFIIKGFLFILSFILLASLLYFIPQSKGYKALFFLSMWVCLYDVIFPTWYFQGIEKMKYITYITLGSRLIFLFLIFLFIHSPSDYLFIPIINGIGGLLGGIISLYIIFKLHELKFYYQSIKTLKFYLYESMPIFVSNLSSKIYVSTNRVIIGATLGLTDLAYFDLADKIVSLLKTPIVLLSQTLFPKISKERDVFFVKKIFKITLLLYIIVFTGTIVFSKFIILFLGGEQMYGAIKVVNLLSIALPFIAINHIIGVLLLISWGFHEIFSKIMLSAGIFYFLGILVLWGLMDISIISITVVFVGTEIFITALMVYFSNFYKLWK